MSSNHERHEIHEGSVWPLLLLGLLQPFVHFVALYVSENLVVPVNAPIEFLVLTTFGVPVLAMAVFAASQKERAHLSWATVAAFVAWYSAVAAALCWLLSLAMTAG